MTWDESKHPRKPAGRPTGGQFAMMSAVERARRKNAAPLPPEPGTMPIPEGHVRLYHQTSEKSLRGIMESGLGIKHARGIEGPRAVYAGETPFYGSVSNTPTFEFSVPRSRWIAPFVLKDVSPRAGVAHLPWHHKARYIKSHSDVLKLTLAGKHDNLGGDSGRAVSYVKREKAFSFPPKFKPKK